MYQFGATALLVFSNVCYASNNLVELYQKAIAYDANYQSALANAQSDREEINKAKALYFPKAQLGLSRGKGVTDKTSNTQIGEINSHSSYSSENYAFTIKQPIFNKETNAIYKGAQFFVSAQEELLRQEKANLILKLTTTFLEALYSNAQLDILQTKISAITQQLHQAESRYKNGAGTLVEVSEAQANLALGRAELIETKNRLAEQVDALGNLTGETQLSKFDLNREKLVADLKKIEDLDSWLDRGNQFNPDIKAAEYNLAVSEQDVEKKKAGHYPTVDMVGVRSYSSNDSNNTLGSSFNSATLGVQMNIPLFSGGYVTASVRQAQEKLTASRESLVNKQRETSKNIRKYFNGINSYILSTAANEQAVRSSELALKGTQQGFVSGLRTNIEVLEAQQKLSSAQLDLIKAYFGLLNDQINLEYSSGVLDEVALAKINQYFVLSWNKNEDCNENCTYK